MVADLVRVQRAAGMRVSVACPPGGPLPGMLETLGCDVLPWQATRSPGPGVLREARALAGVLARARPDLVHAHSAKAGLVARLVVRGRTPTVFQPHAWSFEAVEGVVARLTVGWERLAARWTDRLICVSRAEQLTGRRHGIEAPWRLVPNGVDVERFCPTGPAGAVPRAAAGDGPVVVCVGRLCRQKGQDLLIEAWQDVSRRLPRARLVVVGDGPDAASLRDAAPPSVSFVGAVDDAAPWYRAADLVVLPSRWEGMALAPLEAMACGRPVLVTDVNGAQESLPPSLTPRCLTAPEDARALARALVGLLDDAEGLRALGEEARRHALTHHDVGRTAAAIAAVYDELLGLETIPYREPITT